MKSRTASTKRQVEGKSCPVVDSSTADIMYAAPKVGSGISKMADDYFDIVI